MSGRMFPVVWMCLFAVALFSCASAPPSVPEETSPVSAPPSAPVAPAESPAPPPADAPVETPAVPEVEPSAAPPPVEPATAVPTKPEPVRDEPVPPRVVAGAPPPAPGPVPPVVVPPPVALLAATRELRQSIRRYALDAYAPREFRAGEERFQEGETAYGVDDARSRHELEVATMHYAVVIERGAAAILLKLRQEADLARAAAEAAGADRLFPTDFHSTEERYAGSVEFLSDGEFESAGIGFIDAKQMFEALTVKTEIARIAETALEYDLSRHVADDAGRVAVLYAEAESLFGADSLRSRELFIEARENGEAVLEKAALIVTGHVMTEAESMMARADSMKASVALKEQYGETMSRFTRGVDARKSGAYLDAYRLFETASREFASLYDAALQKKRRAEAALAERKAESARQVERAVTAETELRASGEDVSPRASE